MLMAECFGWHTYSEVAAFSLLFCTAMTVRALAALMPGCAVCKGALSTMRPQELQNNTFVLDWP